MTGDDLRALFDAATPGPWLAAHPGYVWGGDCFDHVLFEPLDQMVGQENAELIAWLRNHADALIDLIDAAQDAVTYAPNGDPNCAHSAGDGVTGLCVHCGFNPALDRLSDALAALDQETPI